MLARAAIAIPIYETLQDGGELRTADVAFHGVDQVAGAIVAGASASQGRAWAVSASSAEQWRALMVRRMHMAHTPVDVGPGEW